MATKREKFSTLDLYLSAFLILRGFEPELKNHAGKVSFDFTISDDLFKAMQDYNSDELIPVAGYVTSIRRLRSQMLSARGTR